MQLRNIKPKRFSDYGPVKSDDAIYPSLTLSFKQLPEAKDWEVGESYQVEMTLKQVSVREDKQGGEATFEIRKVGVDEDEDEDIEESEEGQD